MERDKAVKLTVAAVIGLAAVVLLAFNLIGGPGKPKPAGDQTTPPPAERGGRGRSTPGSGG